MAATPASEFGRSSDRSTGKLHWLIMILGLANGCGTGDASPLPPQLRFVAPLPNDARQGSVVIWQFTVSNLAGNPFDPDELGVEVRIRCPDGIELRHPAFFTADHDVVLDHGREVVRDAGRAHWEIRWTPLLSGKYEWTILATSGNRRAEAHGRLHCTRAEHRGFVRVSAADRRYFEFTDGTFFYPLGHVIRSPSDTRWLANDPRNQAAHDSHMALRTFAYDRWFAEMEKNHENFCAVWMAPWWLGIEWSPNYQGYEGLGRYNQIHAAQLDRILRSAEKHGIYLLLFAMNHGQLSSVTDAEWDASPYRKANGGFVDTASEYFENTDCERTNRNRLRYMLARWGYSPALFAIALSSETDWFEPYDGRRCDRVEEVVEGISKPYHSVATDPSVVDRWLGRMSDYVRSSDVHGHMITTQFSKINSGRNLWSLPAFDFALNNCYEGAFSEAWSKVESGVGTAEALLGWARLHDVKNKPKLLAEWGGSHQQNSHERLASELHTGSWALAMSDCGGSTGFWWWDEVDNANLYPYYGSIHSFFDGFDRRGKHLKSTQSSVSVAIRSRDRARNGQSEFVPHPSRAALMLSNDREGFAYVYSHFMNAGYIAARRMDDLHFDQAEDVYLALPSDLREGRYHVEFWDTFRGVPVAREELRVSGAGPRRLRLVPFRSDLAVKLWCYAD